MATHTSILAWKIPGIEEPGGLQSIGSQTWTQLRNRARMQTYGKSMFWSVPSECQASWPGSLCRGVLWSPAQWNHIQFSSQSCLTLCDPMFCSIPSCPVRNQELVQTHVYQVSDALQPSHPLSSPSPPAFNLSKHQGLFQ